MKQVAQEHKVNQADKDPLDHQENLDPVEGLEVLVNLDHQVKEEKEDHLDYLDNQEDLEALVVLDYLEELEIVDPAALLAHLVHQDNQEQLDYLVCQDNGDLQDLVEQEEREVALGQVEILDQEALQEHQVHLVLLDKKASLDPKDQLDSRVNKDQEEAQELVEDLVL